MINRPSRRFKPGRWSGGAALAAGLAIPLACHFSFSWIGFNPTDDGWLQAVARRLADGEVPHRDFISVRPVLSAVLNVPLALWGGDHAIWLSRLVGWLEIAAIAAIWTRLAAPAARPVIRFALYAGAVFLTAHTFPVMAWHSLDGMLGCSLAVALAARGTRWSGRLAYLAVGLAALCRQNFACFVPVLMLAAPRTARSGDFLWAAIPPLAYYAGLAACGAARDFVAQVLAPGGWFVRVALLPYLREPAFAAGAIVGITAAWLATARRLAGRRLAGLLPAAILAAVGAAAAAALWLGPASFRRCAFALFGLAGGLALDAFRRPQADRDRLLVAGGLGLAWSAAMSVGYVGPALAAGMLFLCLWRLLANLRPAGAAAPRGFEPVLAATVLAVGAAFIQARWQYPYRDRPAGGLDRHAGEVLPGAAGLYTNENTYAALRDLQRVRARLAREGRIQAILTDFPAAWLGTAEHNPLPAPWPQATELAGSPELIARVLDVLARLPPDARIVVQRFRTAELARGRLPVPVDQPYYAVQHWVRARCRPAGVTDWFELYLPPGAADVGTRNRESTPGGP